MPPGALGSATTGNHLVDSSVWRRTVPCRVAYLSQTAFWRQSAGAYHSHVLLAPAGRCPPQSCRQQFTALSWTATVRMVVSFPTFPWTHNLGESAIFDLRESGMGGYVKAPLPATGPGLFPRALP